MTLRPLKVLLVINISWAFCYDETDKETLTAIFKKKPFKSRNVNIESKFFNENCESKQGFLELIITVNLTQIKMTSLNLRNIHFFRKTSHWRFSYHIIVTLLSLEEQLSLWSFNFPPFSWQHVLLSISGVEKAGPLRFNGGQILMQFLT